MTTATTTSGDGSSNFRVELRICGFPNLRIEGRYLSDGTVPYQHYYTYKPPFKDSRELERQVLIHFRVDVENYMLL